jgi:hypothetical protein
MFLMWGYEGEEMEDIEATVQHVSKSQPDIFFTTVSYPIKGTPYFERVRDRLVQLAPWGQSSDREIKIRGRHSRRFYGFADKLLRSEVELAKLQGSASVDAFKAESLRLEISQVRANLLGASMEVEA